MRHGLWAAVASGLGAFPFGKNMSDFLKQKVYFSFLTFTKVCFSLSTPKPVYMSNGLCRVTGRRAITGHRV